MRFFASTLLVAAAQATKLNSIYSPVVTETRDELISYDTYPVQRFGKAPRTDYEVVQDARSRLVPETVYDVVYDTYYREYPKTQYRKVPETYIVDIPITRRIAHEHISEDEGYDRISYKNTHSHFSDSYLDIYNLDSDYSSDLFYHGKSLVGHQSEYSLLSSLASAISEQSDATIDSKLGSDSDYNRARGVRPNVYAADLSSELFDSETTNPYWGYGIRSSEDTEHYTNAESREQCRYGDCYTGYRRTSAINPYEEYEYEIYEDSYSSDDYDISDDLHYHRY